MTPETKAAVVEAAEETGNRLVANHASLDSILHQADMLRSRVDKNLSALNQLRQDLGLDPMTCGDATAAAQSSPAGQRFSTPAGSDGP